MKTPERNPAQELFTRFCEGYKKRDLPSLLKLFTSNINMWGSGVDEYRVGLAQVENQLKRDWKQSESAEIEIQSFVPTALDTLWAAAICKAKITVDGVEKIFDHFRGTITIAQENNIWKISHLHASFPDYRNPSEHSFPVA